MDSSAYMELSLTETVPNDPSVVQPLQSQTCSASPNRKVFLARTNRYDSDVSPTRPDLYEKYTPTHCPTTLHILIFHSGNDYKVIVSQFQQLFDLQPDATTANYDLSVLTPFRATRFQQSISNNPYFFNWPLSGVAVHPAAYTFIYRFMSDKSATYPEGILNQDGLKSFSASPAHPAPSPGQKATNASPRTGTSALSVTNTLSLSSCPIYSLLRPSIRSFCPWGAIWKRRIRLRVWMLRI